MQLNRDYTGQFIVGVFLIILSVFWLFDEPITAQQANVNPALVVDTCNAQTYTTGARSALTVDNEGNLCAGVSVSATIATTGLAISVTAGQSSNGVPITPTGGCGVDECPELVERDHRAVLV